MTTSSIPNAASEPDPVPASPTTAGTLRRTSPAQASGVVSWAERVLGEVNKVFVGQRKLVRGVLGVAPGRGPRADRKRAGAGQDAAGARARPRAGLLVQSHPVHARPDALRRHRLADLRRANQRFPIPARPGLHPVAAGRRDQPGTGQDPLGLAGDHAGKPGHDRRRELSDRAAVSGHGDPEPDRIGGDVQPARGPARPVPLQAGGRVSHAPARRPTSSGCTREGSGPTVAWPTSSTW